MNNDMMRNELIKMVSAEIAAEYPEQFSDRNNRPTGYSKKIAEQVICNNERKIISTIGSLADIKNITSAMHALHDCKSQPKSQANGGVKKQPKTQIKSQAKQQDIANAKSQAKTGVSQ